MTYGNGTDYTDTALMAACTAVGSDVATILLRPGTWTQSVNRDYSAVCPNATLKSAFGAVILHDTYTFSWGGKLDVLPGQYWLNGTGTVTFNILNVPIVYSTWFGSVADGETTDNVAAFKKAVAATPTGGRLVIPSSGTTYYKYDNATNGFSDATTIDRSITIQIDGTIKQTGYLYQANPAFIFYVTGDNVTFTGAGTLQGPGAHSDISPATRANQSGLVLVTGDYFTMQDLHLKDQPTMSIYINCNINTNLFY
jgi:hypothetical protein